MDLEYSKRFEKFINEIPQSYCWNIDGFNKFQRNKKKREYITRVLKFYFKKLEGLDILFGGFATDKMTALYMKNMVHSNNYELEFKSDGTLVICNQLDNSEKSIYIKKADEQSMITQTVNVDIPTELINPILDFANSTDIPKFIQFGYKLSEEYNLYPLERVKEACRCLISIRKFRDSILDTFPLEVVHVIANQLWTTRKDNVWLPTFK